MFMGEIRDESEAQWKIGEAEERNVVIGVKGYESRERETHARGGWERVQRRSITVKGREGCGRKVKRNERRRRGRRRRKSGRERARM